MRRNLWHGYALIFSTLLLTAAFSNATSIPIRGGSGYGPAASFNDCENGTLSMGQTSCEAFGPVVGTFTFNGGGSINIFQFVPGQSGVHSNPLDIFDLGPISAGTTFFLSSINSSLFNPSTAEIFSCGQQFQPLSNPQSFVTASGSSTSLGGACVPNLTSNPLTPNADGSFTANQNISDLVFDVPAPASTATPEPASLALLGFGLAAIGAKLRRKSA